MAPDNIEQLLEKYENAQTTLHEEQQLRAYFAQDNVAPHLEVYKSMFQYFAQTKQEQFDKAVIVPVKKSYALYKWLSVAAAILVMTGLYTQFDKKRSIDDLNEEELMAYNQTMDVLSMVSTHLNKGRETMDVLNLVSENLNEGAGNVKYINEFSKTTEKIIKN